MNKKILIVTLIVVVGAVGVITYFKYLKSGDQLRNIPKTAAVVVSVDLKSLVEKAQADKFKDMNFFKKIQEFASKNNDRGTQIMKRVSQFPLGNGINALQNVYFFADFQKDIPMMGVTATLLSVNAFEGFLDSIPDLKPVITDKGKYKFINP